MEFSQDRVKQLREESARDPVLAPLRDILARYRKETPNGAEAVLVVSRRLAIDDGVILKGSEQVLVPAAMPQYVLTALHAGL